RVRAGLLDDFHDDRVLSVEAGDGSPLGDAVGHPRDLAEPHLRAALRGGDGEVVDLLDVLELAQRADGEPGRAGRETPGGAGEVLGADALGGLEGAGRGR